MRRQLQILSVLFLLATCFPQEITAQCTFTPTVNFDPEDDDGIYCPDVVITLRTQEYDSYQWYYNFVNSNSGGTPWPGGTGQTIDVSASEWALTYFYVEATLDGCTEASATVNWDAWVFLPPSISHSGQTEYCQGESTVINASPGPVFFQWFKDGVAIPDATMSSYTVTETGTYTLLAAYAECPDYWQSSGVGPSFIFHKPIIPEITESEGTLYADSGTTWQWYVDGGAISGATESSYTPGPDGLYEVTVTDINGCSATSEPFQYPENPLPIELISFSAKLQTNCEVIVNWEVTEESTATAYAIEFSNDGQFYNEIKTIQAAYQAYTSFEERIVIPNSAYIRLRMHDVDGTLSYSSVYFLEIPCGIHNENAFKFYPNPASNNFTIENREDIEVVLSVFDIHGSLIIRKETSDPILDLDVSTWTNGIYQVLIEGSTRNWIHRLVKH